MNYFRNTALAMLLLFSANSLKSQEYARIIEANPRIDTMVMVNGKRLHARIHGKLAVGLVLINGFGASQNYWNGLLPGLEPYMGVLTYDREGYGESEFTGGPVDISITAHDLLGLLDRLGIEHPVIVAGHSYGGMIARKFLIDYPERVSGLLLLDSSHEMTKSRTMDLLEGEDLALFRRFLDGPPMAYRFPGMGKEKEAMKQSEQMLIDHPGLPQVPSTVLSAGKRPDYRGFTEAGRQALMGLDRELQQELGSRIPGTTYRIIEEAGHNIHLSAPEAVTEAILSLLPVFIQSSWTDSTWTMDIELGDIDGDGDPDALLANMRLKPFTFWVNDGSGQFTKTTQEFPVSCHGVELADLDGDADLDAFIVPNARDPHKILVWMNDGTGRFTESGQGLGSFARGLDVQLADLDKDGDQDAYIQFYKSPNEFYLNDGSGQFTLAEGFFSPAAEHPAYLQDLNRDGMTDMVIKTDEGMAAFLCDRDRGYSKTTVFTAPIEGYCRTCFADFDLDGDADILVKEEGKDAVHYMNDGNGVFSETACRIDAGKAARVVVPAAADLNNDSYPDLLFLIQDEPNQVWLNNKNGGFTDSGIRLDGSIFAVRAACGDLDRDGDQDIFIVSGPKRDKDELIICPNQVWINQLVRNKAEAP